jgi:hypothetical protein
MSREILLLVDALMQAAYTASWVDTAVLLGLGFHTFARSGELFNAPVGDFALSAAD